MRRRCQDHHPADPLHPAEVDVVPLPVDTTWLPDARDDERALRVSWHHELGRVVLSTWRGGRCTGTVQLDPEDAARLITWLAGDEAGWITGEVINSEGGFAR